MNSGANRNRTLRSTQRCRQVVSEMVAQGVVDAEVNTSSTPLIAQSMTGTAGKSRYDLRPRDRSIGADLSPVSYVGMEGTPGVCWTPKYKGRKSTRRPIAVPRVVAESEGEQVGVDIRETDVVNEGRENQDPVVRNKARAIVAPSRISSVQATAPAGRSEAVNRNDAMQSGVTENASAQRGRSTALCSDNGNKVAATSSHCADQAQRQGQRRPNHPNAEKSCPSGKVLVPQLLRRNAAGVVASTVVQKTSLVGKVVPIQRSTVVKPPASTLGPMPSTSVSGRAASGRISNGRTKTGAQVAAVGRQPQERRCALRPPKPTRSLQLRMRHSRLVAAVNDNGVPAQKKAPKRPSLVVRPIRARSRFATSQNVTITKPFVLQTQLRGDQYKEKFDSKVADAKRSDAEKAKAERIFRASSADVLKRRQWVPKKVIPEAIAAAPFNLHVEERLTRRRSFDRHAREAATWKADVRQANEQLQIRNLRRQREFKATTVKRLRMGRFPPGDSGPARGSGADVSNGQ
jgi:hypothetical protein